ncbi:uncharacterized protein CXorf38-like [Nelusetta ayraudi]|uniref:uncharacterized protein CXorf38-like n=1 Tax=Nelusetta ayraudi TaxID=303726 RepID=UPI003F6F235B
MSEELMTRLNDDGYKNWIKASQCLKLLQRALHPFASSRMSSFHQELLHHHGPLRRPCEAKCRARGNTLPALCRTCHEWQTVILTHHRQGDSAIVNWGNCYPPRWRRNFWEVAKAYMPRGQSDVSFACQCDTPALLNLINFCDCFHSVDLKCVSELIRFRNKLMHSLELSVSDDWMEQYWKSLKKIMQDLSPEGAAVEREIQQMLSVNLSICVLDDKPLPIVHQGPSVSDTDSPGRINGQVISYWEERLLQERLQEFLQAASDGDGDDAAKTQAVVQLKRLQVFLQDNRDLSKRFSAELQDISSVLAANQGDKDEECVLA